MFAAFISLLITQRIVELIFAERNRRWSLAQGGRESGTAQYRVIVAIHTLFFVSLTLEWLYLSAGWNRAWPLWLVLLLAAECIRFWAILSLGRRWNTRIIVVPGMKPVMAGPYRYIRHPNYLAVAIELLSVPVLCGAYFTAAAFSAANVLILMHRIPMEERAMANAGRCPMPDLPRFIPRASVRRSGRRV